MFAILKGTIIHQQKASKPIIFGIRNAPFISSTKLLRFGNTSRMVTQSSRNDSKKDLLETTSYLEKIGPLNRQIKEEEDNFRKTFSYKVVEPNAGNSLLINVFNERSSFHNDIFSSLPLILTANRTLSPEFPIVEQPEFVDNWSLLTLDVFKGMNWSNVVASGGSVLGCLLPNFSKTIDGETVVGCNGFHKTDIDLFIYGLSEEESNNKIQEILETVAKNTESPCDLLISQHSVTIIGIYPHRNIQIVLRRYRSLSEVLIGFDIDCCSFGYDGTNVYCLPRSRRAINNKFNLVDGSRRSITYESRLYKYAKRGFAVAVPGIEFEYLDEEKLKGMNVYHCSGLTKLLVYDQKMKTTDLVAEAKRYHDNVAKKHADSLAVPFVMGASDYAWLPSWGVLTRDRISQFYKNKQTEFNARDGSKVMLIPAAKFSQARAQKLFSWIVSNPGSQLFTGSFHPISDGEWTDRKSWDTRFVNESSVTKYIWPVLFVIPVIVYFIVY